ncbi:hypothetical protein Plhal304r1_c090g0171231 [Plasmopara halstedii]
MNDFVYVKWKIGVMQRCMTIMHTFNPCDTGTCGGYSRHKTI